MNLQSKIHELNEEWADAGDDVPLYLQVIRELVERLDRVARAMDDRGNVNWDTTIQTAGRNAGDLYAELQP
jgi:hypothetical protein